MTEAQAEEVKLEPCPKCHSTEVGESHYLGLSGRFVFYVGCQLCGIRQVASTKAQARRDWNTRPTPSPASEEEGESLAKKLAAWANCGFQDEDYQEALDLMGQASRALRTGQSR